MKNMLSLIICSLLIATACSKNENSNQSKPDSSAAQAATQSDGNSSSTDSNAPTLNPGEIPFEAFPTVPTTAKQGEYVLCPSYAWIQDAITKGPDKVTFIFYAQRMVASGEVESEIDFSSSTGKRKVPNPYIIPIPAGQTAQTGDIILTWWQSGSGMKRAIVVEASDPRAPTVRYLDIDYDNPAKSRDGKTTIGQMDEKIKPDTFVKLNNEWEPGTVVAARDGRRQKHAHVIRVAGDKVFVLGFAGKMKVYDKADCTPLPLVPDVKSGDSVKVPFAGGFTDATVNRVDSKIGRVFVTIGVTKKEEAIAFGDVAKSL